MKHYEKSLNLKGDVESKQKSITSNVPESNVMINKVINQQSKKIISVMVYTWMLNIVLERSISCVNL